MNDLGKDNRPIEVRLNEVGIFIDRSDCLDGRRNNAMMLDAEGNKLGYYPPLKALKKFVLNK